MRRVLLFPFLLLAASAASASSISLKCTFGKNPVQVNYYEINPATNIFYWLDDNGKMLDSSKLITTSDEYKAYDGTGISSYARINRVNGTHRLSMAGFAFEPGKCSKPNVMF